MKRYIIVTRYNGYCGCDSVEYYAFPDVATNRDIDEYIDEGMYDYAQSYSHVATGWGNVWESEGAEEYYYTNCDFYWVEISEEEAKEKGIENFFKA